LPEWILPALGGAGLSWKSEGQRFGGFLRRRACVNETVLNNVFGSLDIMWKGMLGLFVVCGGVAVVMILISKLTARKK
jgi:hypothetical protein